MRIKCDHPAQGGECWINKNDMVKYLNDEKIEAERVSKKYDHKLYDSDGTHEEHMAWLFVGSISEINTTLKKIEEIK